MSTQNIDKQRVEMALNRLQIGESYSASESVVITQTGRNLFSVSYNDTNIGDDLSFVQTVMMVINL